MQVIRFLPTGALALVTLALVALGGSSAAVLPPAALDAGTGKDAVDVGASMGAHKAWAGFLQQTGGMQRLYVAYAEDGTFHAPGPADRGNAVAAAALGGNQQGAGVAVFTEKVGAAGVLFARRLSGGQLGTVAQISKPGQNAQLPSPDVGLKHRRVVAMNDAGAAAVCYSDAAANAADVAIADAGSDQWKVVGPLASTSCDDVAIDARGNVIVVGNDMNAKLFADRIVGGQLHSDQVDPNGKDEPSLAITSAGAALILGRIDTGNGFAGVAWRKTDIATNDPWKPLGRIDTGARSTAQNTEFPRAALNTSGKGVFTFRVNDPGTGSVQLFAAPADATAAIAVFGAPQKLADVKFGQEAIPSAGDGGQDVVAYNASGSNGKTLPFVRVLAAGALGSAVSLVPESSDDAQALNVGSFVTDTPGDVLSLVRSKGNPARVLAAFADFLPPALSPTAQPATPRLGQPTYLLSNATDGLDTHPAVQWTFPPGAVAGGSVLAGDDVMVEFLRVGTIPVQVSAADRGGNRAESTLRVAVAPAAARLRISPSTIRPGSGAVFSGAGFVPRLTATLRMGPPRSDAVTKLFSVQADANGSFRARFRFSRAMRPGSYVVFACQLKCRVTARARVRIG